MYIGSAQLEYVYDAKYLGFMFCENKKDDCDMLKATSYFICKI